jgi:ribosomal protein L3 glutamine methyltransferase
MHELSDRVEIIQSNLFSELDGRQYDLIVSNPPYVPHQSMLELPEEYSHEPVMALEAEDEGMAIVDKILHQSARYLKENGILIVEVGEIQQAVEDRYSDLPFTWLEFERGGDGVFLLNKADLPV